MNISLNKNSKKVKKLLPFLQHLAINGTAFAVIFTNISMPFQVTVDQQTTGMNGQKVGFVTTEDVGSSQNNDLQDPKSIPEQSIVNSQKVASNPNPVAHDVQKQIISPYIQEYVLGDFVLYDGSTTKYPIRTYETSVTPNDPQSGQWWENSLNLSQAWSLGTGSVDTLLAIIDTGFALDHEEFSGRWHTNSGESGIAVSESASKLNCSDQSIPLNQNCNLVDDNYDGIVDNESGATTVENKSQLNCSDQSVPLDKSCNMIDDDSNGFTDDWRGWDFVSYDRSVLPGETDPNGPGTRHGTYVVGAAAANANNSKGIAGVNWRTKILPVQALSDSGSGSTISVARAIRYAVDQGADVISLSLGSAYPDAFLRQTITDAIAAGVIVVAAAGNDGCDCISYPANYEEVVAVGALNSSNARASFSSYGANLDIMAPGVGLYTTSWTPTNQTSTYASNIAGTSLAAPLVSAALTLLKDHQPHATQTELLALLMESTNRLTLPSGANRSDTLGFGTTDLHAAAFRAINSVAHPSIISFDGVSHGQTLSSANLEKSNVFNGYVCDHGTTAVYRLEKSGNVFYSSSSSEIGLAKANGYSSHLLGYLCAIMPSDSIDSVRLINTFLELENILIK